MYPRDSSTGPVKKQYQLPSRVVGIIGKRTAHPYIILGRSSSSLSPCCRLWLKLTVRLLVSSRSRSLSFFFPSSLTLPPFPLFLSYSPMRRFSRTLWAGHFAFAFLHQDNNNNNQKNITRKSPQQKKTKKELLIVSRFFFSVSVSISPRHPELVSTNACWACGCRFSLSFSRIFPFLFFGFWSHSLLLSCDLKIVPVCYRHSSAPSSEIGSVLNRNKHFRDAQKIRIWGTKTTAYLIAFLKIHICLYCVAYLSIWCCL